MNHKKAVIIGSGIAGIAAAIRLAVNGMQVSVYEKNPLPGGKLSSFKEKNYHFDSGPSLFTQPKNIEELFILAGEPIEEYFQYKPVDISCKYFFDNGKIVNGYTQVEMFADEMQEKTGEPGKSVKKYLSISEKVYNNIGSVFLNYSLHKRSTWLHPRIFKAFVTVRLPYLFSSLASYNKRFFKTNEARQIFNRFATYNGSNPYKAPAMLNLIPHLEMNQGTFHPTGGMISITNALYKLALKKGVQFYFNHPVDRIIHAESRVLGIVVNNQNILADIVVSNADVYFTFRDLLGYNLKAKKLLKNERSSSALIFYWGITKPHPELGLHNIFFSKDYKQEFDCIFQKNFLYADPTIYINITSKMETSHAPAGKENWFVMINVPANKGQDWEKWKEQARKNIISKLNRMLSADVEQLIESEEIMDPVQLEKSTGSYMGSLYGTSSNSKKAAFSRPANFTSFANGLYFCGGSVHPGGGIPLCLKSARITADIISRDIKSYSHA